MRPRKPSSPKDQALRLLARREHSAKELALKLKRKSRDRVVPDTLSADELSPELEALMESPRAPTPVDTDALISELQADEYQSDERFARVLVRRRAADGYGPVRIRAELKSHGIAGPMIEQAFNEADVDWPEQLDRQIHRYVKLATGSRQEQLKLAAKLQQRGFSGDQIRSAMRRAAAGQDRDDGFDD